jgi:hypothetical protein
VTARHWSRSSPTDDVTDDFVDLTEMTELANVWEHEVGGIEKGVR